MAEGLAARIRRGFKPREVEELIDYYFHRPLAGLLVQALLPLPFTPNQVTAASGVFGLLAGVAIGYAGWGPSYWAAIGGGLLLLSILFDCADGQLARLRGIASPAGRILDGLVDFVAPTAVFFGQAALLLGRGESIPIILLVGMAAGGGLLWHAGQFDSVKNRYLHNTKLHFDLGGEALLTREYVEQLRQDYAAKGETFNSLLMWGFNKWWLSVQEKGGGADLGQHAAHAENEAECEAYREVYQGHMRAWTWLGFGTHLFVLTVACVVGMWTNWGIWIAWAVVAVPMNLLCAILLRRRADLDGRFFARLEALRGASES